MTYENEQLRDLARGQPCQAEVAGICNHRDDTTVWAHSNELRHGKGKGLKADDCFGAFMCSACHSWLDSDKTASRQEKQAVFRDAFERTLLFLWQHGLIGVAGHRLPAAKRAEPRISITKKSLPVRHARSIVREQS